mgnify:CR=1 FL=1
MKEIKEIIESAWDNRALLQEENTIKTIRKVVDLLDKGELRVAEPVEDGWQVNEWVKKAVVLYFPIQKMETLEAGIFEYHDKIPLKRNFEERGIRVVPNAVARHGAYISSGTILMPSYVNIGAYVDEGTMVDTWATVGSCAQIGSHVHLSGGVGIGGVLEPLQATPTIIEGDCFIGARSEVVEGVIIGKGSVLSMGVYIGKSTRIYDRESGEIMYGKVPPGSVVVPGSLPAKDHSYAMYAAIIVKRVDEQTRSKTSVNELLRASVES